MSQSAVSKAHSKNDKKYFTLGIAGTAKYFSVSVEWLLGVKDTSGKIYTDNIAEFIVSLIENDQVTVSGMKFRSRFTNIIWQMQGT